MSAARSVRLQRRNKLTRWPSSVSLNLNASSTFDLFSGYRSAASAAPGFIMAGRNRLACFGAREKGTCDNRLTIRREEVTERNCQMLWIGRVS